MVTSPLSQSQKWVLLGTFTTLLLALLLLAAELALRFQYGAWPFHPPRHASPGLGEDEQVLRWRPSASDGRNRLGLNSKPIAPKTQDMTRLFFLGDSLLFDSATSAGIPFPAAVEKRLNADGRFAKAVDVVNGGIYGYTTYQELAFFRLHGLATQPDAVVLGFVFNDVYYPYLHYVDSADHLAFEPDYRLQRIDDRHFPGNLLSWSYLAATVQLTLDNTARRLSGRPEFSFETRPDFFLAWKPHPWARVRQLIGELKTLLDDRRIPLLVVLFPMVDQVDPALPAQYADYVLYPQARMREICAGLDLPCLDLTPYLRDGGGPALFKDHLHLGPQGNDLVADVVSDFLEQRLATRH